MRSVCGDKGWNLLLKRCFQGSKAKITGGSRGLRMIPGRIFIPKNDELDISKIILIQLFIILNQIPVKLYNSFIAQFYCKTCHLPISDKNNEKHFYTFMFRNIFKKHLKVF